LHHRRKHVQIAQLEAAADLALPVDFPSHGDSPVRNLSKITENSER
jgi:hypothetical protein